MDHVNAVPENALFWNLIYQGKILCSSATMLSEKGLWTTDKPFSSSYFVSSSTVRLYRERELYVHAPSLLVHFWWISSATYRPGIWTTACWVVYNRSVWTQVILKRCQGRRGGGDIWYMWTWSKRGCSMLWTSGKFVFLHRFCLCLISCFFAGKFNSTALSLEGSWWLFWSLKSFGPTEESEVDLRHSIQDLFSFMCIGLVHPVSVRCINNLGWKPKAQL